VIRVYRLCKTRWATTAFSGEGAVRYSGRWHQSGTPIIYTAQSRALAALEILVHMEIRHAPKKFVMIPADVPDSLVTTLAEPPKGWDLLPAGDIQRKIGTDWAQSNASVGLLVPSVVVRGEHNLLLNPLHPKFSRVKVGTPEPFAFDPRLLPASS